MTINELRAAGWVVDRERLSATLDTSTHRLTAWCFGGYDVRPLDTGEVVITGPTLPLLGATLGSAALACDAAFRKAVKS